MDAMRIPVAADERLGVADAVVSESGRRGHDVLGHGAARRHSELDRDRTGAPCD